MTIIQARSAQRARVLRNTSKVPSSEFSARPNMDFSGYQKRVNPDGSITYLKSAEYSADSKGKKKESYNTEVVVVDSSGNIVRLEKYGTLAKKGSREQPYLKSVETYADSGLQYLEEYEKITNKAGTETSKLKRRIRPGDEGYFEIEQRQNRDMTPTNSGGSQSSSRLPEKVVSVTKNLKTGEVRRTLANPTYEEAYEAVRSRAQEKRRSFLASITPESRERVESAREGSIVVALDADAARRVNTFDSWNAAVEKNTGMSLDPLQMSYLQRRQELAERDEWKPKDQSNTELALASVNAAQDFVMKPVRGVVKQVAESRLGRAVRKDFFGERLEQFSVAKMISDDDVQSAMVVEGLLLAGAASPAAAAVIEYGGMAYGLTEIGSGVATRNPTKIGEGTVMFAGSRPFKKVARVSTELFGTKISAETVFADVSGKKATSRTVEESLAQFEAGRTRKGDLEVVHASDRFIKGELGGGPKGAAGVEDPLFYMGPKGRAQMQFTGAGGQSSGSDVSFNPFQKEGTPTVSIFTVKGIVRYPRKVIMEPGFTSKSQLAFIEGLKGSGFALMTKRSELGFGAVPRQKFVPKGYLKAWGRSFKPGKATWEPATTESEVGLPTGTLAERIGLGSLKERFRYTVVNQRRLLGFDIPLTGDLVRLPRYRVVFDDAVSFRPASGTRFGRGKRSVVDDVLAADEKSLKDYSTSRAKRRPTYELSNNLSKGKNTSTKTSTYGSGRSGGSRNSRSSIWNRSLSFGSYPSGRRGGYSGRGGPSSPKTALKSISQAPRSTRSTSSSNKYLARLLSRSLSTGRPPTSTPRQDKEWQGQEQSRILQFKGEKIFTVNLAFISGNTKMKEAF